MPETDEEYEDEYEDDYEDVPRKKKSEKPKKSKMQFMIIIIILAVILVVILFIMGLGGGIDDITVTTTAYDEDDSINIAITTHTSGTLGSKPSGNVDYIIEFSNGTGDYEGTIKISSGGGNIDLPIEKFYVDNGQYDVSISYEGKSSTDIINIDKTVKAIVVEAYDEEDKDGLEVTFDLAISKQLETLGEGDDKISHEIPQTSIVSPIGNGTLIIKYNNSDETEKKSVYWTNFSTISRKITWENGNQEDIGVMWSKILIKYDDFFDEEGTYTAYVEFTNSIGTDKQTYSASDINPEYIK